jgi:hypothetical protein
MSDSLLPDGITISSGKTLEEQPAVCIDLGKLLELSDAGIRVTISLVLPVRQAKAFASLILRQAQEIERHGLRVVSDEDGA